PIFKCPFFNSNKLLNSLGILSYILSISLHWKKKASPASVKYIWFLYLLNKFTSNSSSNNLIVLLIVGCVIKRLDAALVILFCFMTSTKYCICLSSNKFTPFLLFFYFIIFFYYFFFIFLYTFVLLIYSLFVLFLCIYSFLNYVFFFILYTVERLTSVCLSISSQVSFCSSYKNLISLFL